MKVIVILLLIAVIASLFSGLFFMFKANSSERMARALTIRVVLSIAIFAILMGSYYFGLIPRQ